MATPFHIILRRRGKTEKRAFATLAEAVDALETELRAAATAARQAPRAESALGRVYDPDRVVVLRGELRGPGRVRAGVDVHGDGSAAAFTGFLRRRPLDGGERGDAWSALRREVGLPAR